MELHEIPEAFQSRLRLMMISALLTGEKSFNELKSLTQATDGNLSVQLTKLEGWGYVRTERVIENKKTRTIVFLTDEGRADFHAYVRMLTGLCDLS